MTDRPQRDLFPNRTAEDHEADTRRALAGWLERRGRGVESLRDRSRDHRAPHHFCERGFHCGGGLMDPAEKQEETGFRVNEVLTTDLLTMGAPYNPRSISRHDLEALRRSLRFFGAVEPIVVNRRSGNIVGGHQRVKAAEAEGMESLPVVYVNLDDPGEKQLNLALNRISGDFDPEKLASVLADLDAVGANLGLTGFTSDEIEELCRPPGDPKAGETDPDAIPVPPSAPATRLGDLITLGDHRLLCGDATNIEDVVRLLCSQQASCMWTDPPYGVDYVGKTGDAMTIESDGSEGLARLLALAFGAAEAALAPGAAIYVASPAGRNSGTFAAEFLATGWRLHQTLVWLKDTMVLGHSDYHYKHEPILYGYKPGAGRRGRGGKGWYGGNSETSVLEIPRPKASREHPTSKTVALIARCLQNSTENGAAVYDPFVGSGSTLIACQQLGRRCYALEIDPRYCDVVVQRWQDFTGREAEGWRGNENA